MSCPGLHSKQVGALKLKKYIYLVIVMFCFIMKAINDKKEKQEKDNIKYDSIQRLCCHSNHLWVLMFEEFLQTK